MAMLNNQRVTFSLVTVSENTKTGWRIPWTPRLEAPNLRFDPTDNPNRPSNSFQAIPIIMGIMGIGSFYNVLLSLWLAKPSHLGYPSWSFVNRRSLLPWLFYRGSPVPTGHHINPRSWNPTISMIQIRQIAGCFIIFWLPLHSQIFQIFMGNSPWFLMVHHKKKPPFLMVQWSKSLQVLKRSKTPERPEGVWAAAVYGGGHPAPSFSHGDGIMDDLKPDQMG